MRCETCQNRRLIFFWHFVKNPKQCQRLFATMTKTTIYSFLSWREIKSNQAFWINEYRSIQKDMLNRTWHDHPSSDNFTIMLHLSAGKSFDPSMTPDSPAGEPRWIKQVYLMRLSIPFLSLSFKTKMIYIFHVFFLKICKH